MSPTLTTLLFETANFLLLAGVLGWLFFRPVRQALADHRAKFESDNLRAAKKLEEAEKIGQDVSNQLANLQTELNEQRLRAIESARLQAEQLVSDARAVANLEREQSLLQASHMTDSQRDVLAKSAALAAAEMVERLLRQIDGPELHAALIQSACKQLRSLPKKSIGIAKIEFARPLTAKQISDLNASMGVAEGATELRTVIDLGAGIRISTAAGLVDASVSGLARFASQSLINQMNQRVKKLHPLSEPPSATNA